MPTDSRTLRKYENFPSFVTYGATPTWSSVLVFQRERSRNWSRAFKNRREMLQSLLANGYLPTQAYVDNLSDIVNGKVVNVSGQLNSDPRSTYSWSFIPTPARYPVDPSTDRDVANAYASVLAQLQSRISGNGTNLAVSAMEAKQTVGMIGDAAMKLNHAYGSVRRGRFLEAARTLGLATVPRGVKKQNSPGNNWLEYRYGWRLVVKDASSLMETLHDSLTTRPPILRVTAVAKGQSKYSWDLGVTNSFLPNGTTVFSKRTTKLTSFDWEVNGGYVYQLESVPLSMGQSFGLLNPLTFAWEIIPYSFVVDWFVNVGSVLEGLTAFQGKTCLDGWICKMVQSSTVHRWTGVTKSSSVWTMKCSLQDLSFGPVLERRFVRYRQVFTPTSLRLDLDLNVSRVIDAVFLMKQRL